MEPVSTGKEPSPESSLVQGEDIDVGHLAGHLVTRPARVYSPCLALKYLMGQQKGRKLMNGDTQIYVSGREYKVPGDLVTYEEIVKIWNKLHEEENKHIIGTPGIDYEDDLKGEDGVLLPGKDVRAKDGTSFSVDPEHVS